MTLIIGAYGSMGKRYQAILKYLKEPFDICDKGHIVKDYSIYSSIILATPTYTHLSIIKMIDHYKIPILCEKPLATNAKEIEEILACKSPLSMMMQYLYLSRADGSEGDSYYDYFRHGDDGLVWDCFQVIALADGYVVLSGDSPVWRCFLNGSELDFQKMDFAYIEAVKDFLAGKYISKQLLETYHKKVLLYEAKWRKRFQ